MTVATRVAHHARSLVLEDAIRDRWAYRTWYRTTARSLFEDRWADLAAENDAQIRRLVRLARRERSWTESELREAYGR